MNKIFKLLLYYNAIAVEGVKEQFWKSEIVSKLSRMERKALRTRKLILDSARELFEEQPYEEVRMGDISQRADLSRATLYNYFPSKEAIYLEVGIEFFQEICERQRKVITSEHSGLDQIGKLSEDALRILFEHPLVHQTMRHFLVTNSQAEITAEETLKRLEEGQKVDDASRPKYLREIRRFEKIWRESIERGFRDGSIRHELNSNQLTHFLFMIISGIFDRINLERIPLKRVGLSEEYLIRMTVDLIRKDLAND